MNSDQNDKELQKKIDENAKAVKELAKSDPPQAEDFNKLQKSDQTLEDLRK